MYRGRNHVLLFIALLLRTELKTPVGNNEQLLAEVESGKDLPGQRGGLGNYAAIFTSPSTNRELKKPQRQRRNGNFAKQKL